MFDLLALYAKGIAVGFSVSAPIGPIGIMCIRRTLSHGPKWGLAVGLGAATADVTYSTAAAFGLGALEAFLLPWQVPLRFVAAAIIAWLAARVFRAYRFPDQLPPATSLRGTYVTSLTLVITNPGAIAIFAGAFIGFGLTSVQEWESAAAIVSGVGTGAISWWLILTGSLTLLKPRVDDRWLRRVNLVSGTALAAISAFILYTAVAGLGS